MPNVLTRPWSLSSSSHSVVSALSRSCQDSSAAYVETIHPRHEPCTRFDNLKYLTSFGRSVVMSRLRHPFPSSYSPTHLHRFHSSGYSCLRGYCLGRDRSYLQKTVSRHEKARRFTGNNRLKKNSGNENVYTTVFFQQLVPARVQVFQAVQINVLLFSYLVYHSR